MLWPATVKVWMEAPVVRNVTGVSRVATMIDGDRRGIVFFGRETVVGVWRRDS